LNTRIDNNSELDSSRRQLEKQADDSAARLSQREAELEKAVEEISDTRSRLHRAANYDLLTDLPNRTLFLEQLSQVLQDTNLELDPVGLLLLNVSKFRRINETLGDNVGDEVLRQVAERLRTFVQETSAIADRALAAPEIRLCRVGGDEFSVLLERLHDADVASECARQIVALFAEPIRVQSHELTLAVNIGVARAPAHGDTAAALLSAANAAMRHCAGHQGGYLVFCGKLEASGIDDFRLESDLRKALEKDQLALLYQPQVDTFDGSVTGAEALLRWEHPELGP